MDTKVRYDTQAAHFLDSRTDLNQHEVLSLVQGLKDSQLWELLSRVAEKASASFDQSGPIVASYLEALRNLERYEEGLQYVLTRNLFPEDADVAGQVAYLLCETGDFAGALDRLRPFTTPASGASDELLNLRGWAHQNSYDATHATEGIEVFKEALAQLANPASQAAKTELHGKDTGEEAQSVRNLRSLKEVLYRKGYANALRRIPASRSAASVEYRKVVAQCQQGITGYDPFAKCILGWCYFRLGELQSAAQAYKMAYTFGIPPFGIQFDYALVLFSMGTVNTALQQYRKVICDLRGASPFLRAGTLRVSLFELCDAIATNKFLQNKPQAKLILDNLFGALTEAVSEFADTFEDLKNRIRTAVAEITAEAYGILGNAGSGTAIPSGVIDWKMTTVAGFVNAKAKPCGLFMPVVHLQNAKPPAKLFVFEHEDTEGGAMPRIKLTALGAATGVERVPFAQPANPATRVLYLSQEALTVFGSSQRGKPPDLQSLSSQDFRSFENGAAACVSLEQGRKTLEEIARNLIRRTLDSLRESKGKPRQGTAEAMRVAVVAARSPRTLYQAALCYAMASKRSCSAYKEIRFKIIPDEEAIRKSAIPRFRKMLRLPLNKAISGRPLDKNEQKQVSEFIRNVFFARATEISEIKDVGLKLREATWAAAEAAAAILMTPEALDVRKRLTQRLPISGSVWYLEDNVEILILSREPAFYCSYKTEFSKQALDVFEFYKFPSTLNRSFQESLMAAAAGVASDR